MSEADRSSANRSPEKPPRDPEPILILRGVSRSFVLGGASVHALRNVSMQVLRGEIVAIVGPSGSGKTTLLNIVGGLDRADEGEVFFRNQNLSDCSDRELVAYRRRHVGFVFQFFNLIQTLTALENVQLAADLVDDPLRPEQVLEAVALKDRMHHFPAQLSGGEQQRVAIARALAKNPALLLCDEPTGALDFETAKHVLSFIERLPGSFGTTVLIVTHNQAIAAMCHRLYRLRSGEIVEEKINPAPVPAQSLEW